MLCQAGLSPALCLPGQAQPARFSGPRRAARASHRPLHRHDLFRFFMTRRPPANRRCPYPCSGPSSPPARAADPGAGLLLERQLDMLAAHLAGPRDFAAPPRPELPRVYGWLVTPAGRRRVKCLLDSGASHCVLSRALAARFRAGIPRRRGTRPPCGRRTARCARRAAPRRRSCCSAASTRRRRFLEFDVDCDADIILGYDWLCAHDLNVLYESNAVCFCTERGCTSGRRVRLERAGRAGDASLAGRFPRSTWHRRPRRGADARPSVPLGPSGGASVGRCRARRGGHGRMGRGRVGRPC